MLNIKDYRVRLAALGLAALCLAATSGIDWVTQVKNKPFADARAYSGSDIGAKLNAAYAALPATGGVIRVPAGSYTFSTPIVFGTAGKCPVIEGDSRIATELIWSGSTSATVVKFDCYSWPTGGGVSPGFGLRDVRIRNSVSAGTTEGVRLGAVSGNGAAGWFGSNLDVIGFNTNLIYGDNTWMTECVHCNFDLPGTANLNIPSTLTNSGESIGFTNSVFANSLSGDGAHKASCVVNGLGALITFKGGSFDNCQFVQSDGWGVTQFLGVNFENPIASNTTHPYWSISSGTVECYGCAFLQDKSTGSVPTEFIAASAGNVYLHGGWYTNANSTPIRRLTASGTANVLMQAGTNGGSISSPSWSSSSSGWVRINVDGGSATSAGVALEGIGTGPIVVTGGPTATTHFAVFNRARNAYLLYSTEAGVVATSHNTLDNASGQAAFSGLLDASTKGVKLPTSATGLASGTLWNNAGTPAIVP